ncbi:hypothetical protein VCUG_01364 [Vavraia culicis subsp. floridensis]|uniref:Uncharacterized protein n=1 Tax=Vavraia culicis (isolate floridensis) TaxID=948595 RepID=L2GVN8_VAVCU|nr:uncharacterized protein VCUG_01364 [Vavraia culicis subsp. floridensis]ELA47175.1 hypothetical protein VCUG_01364 [Vavraia culicis subsp. floridensis]
MDKIPLRCWSLVLNNAFFEQLITTTLQHNSSSHENLCAHLKTIAGRTRPGNAGCLAILTFIFVAMGKHRLLPQRQRACDTNIQDGYRWYETVIACNFLFSTGTANAPAVVEERPFNASTGEAPSKINKG